MIVATGIDVGSASIKFAAVRVQEGSVDPRALGGGERPDGIEVLGMRGDRIRRRDPNRVVDEGYRTLLHEAGIDHGDVGYVATTGEADTVSFRTGHFYGMTTHARGALHFEPSATGALDVGALHARAILMDDRSKVLGYRMTSQCASGSGQFLENISRYLGVGLGEVGELSQKADDPEKPSSICAVLSETDVINMVSRGIKTENILKGIHLSMAERYAKLLRAAGIEGIALMTGGLAGDVGLVQALHEEIERQKVPVELRPDPDSIYAGALGAALWGAFRHAKLGALNQAGAA
jgi:benzoyl-CoA reductase subunit D